MSFLCKLAIFFLLGFIILGGITAIGLGPFQAPDEFSHWSAAIVRAGQIEHDLNAKCGKYFSLSSFFKADFVSFIPKHKFPSGIFSTLRQVNVPETCITSEVSYGNPLTYFSLLGGWQVIPDHKTVFNEVMLFYFSRIFNGMVIATIIGRLIYVLHNRRKNGWGLFLFIPFLWSPLFVQQSFSLTSDVIINMFAISTVTLVASLPQIKILDLFIFIICGFIAVCTKPFIVPVALIPLVALAVHWFAHHRSEKMNVRQIGTGVMCLSIVIAGFIYFFSLGGASGIAQTSNGANAKDQMNFILHNIPKAFYALNNRMSEMFTIETYVSGLGWLDTSTPSRLVSTWKGIAECFFALEFIALLYFLITQFIYGKGWRKTLLMSASLMIAALCYSGIFANFLALYLTWTPVGHSTVIGIQPRYFLPYIIAFTSVPVLLANLADVRQQALINTITSLKQKWGLVLTICQALVFIVLAVNFTFIASLLTITWLGRYW